MRRRFEFQEGDSNKFWEIEIDGSSVTTWWGKIGTSGQTKTKELGSAEKALKEYTRLVAEKTQKGYEEIEAEDGEERCSDVFQFVSLLIKAASIEDAREILLDEKETYGAREFIFWIDWKEYDDMIVEACEEVLQTGQLEAEPEEDTADWELYINYNKKRFKVLLTNSMSDRHVTLCALNEILNPEYEIRFCTLCDGETLAFMPLATDDWNKMEKLYGSSVVKNLFEKLSRKNNLFTGEELPEPVLLQL